MDLTDLIAHPSGELVEESDELVRGDVGDEAAHEAVDGLALRVVEPQRDEPGEEPLSYDVCLSHSRNLSALSLALSNISST